MDRGLRGEVGQHPADEGLVHPGRPILLAGQRAALAAGVEQDSRGRQLPPGRQEVLAVHAEDQHAAGAQQAVEPAEPGAEGRFRQVGEERGDEDGVEGLPALETGRIGVRDEAVDAELRLLEAHAALVDVRHPDPLRGDVAHREAGHPAVAAGEVEELERPVRTSRIAEPPAQDRPHRLPDPAAGVEVEDQRPVAVLAAEVEVLDQHLVPGVDVEARRRLGAGGEAEGGEEGVVLFLLVGERHQDLRASGGPPATAPRRRGPSTAWSRGRSASAAGGRAACRGRRARGSAARRRTGRTRPRRSRGATRR